MSLEFVKILPESGSCPRYNVQLLLISFYICGGYLLSVFNHLYKPLIVVSLYKSRQFSFSFVKATYRVCLADWELCRISKICYIYTHNLKYINQLHMQDGISSIESALLNIIKGHNRSNIIQGQLGNRLANMIWCPNNLQE